MTCPKCPESCGRSSLEGYGIYYCKDLSEDNAIRCPIQLEREQYDAVRNAVTLARRA